MGALGRRLLGYLVLAHALSACSTTTKVDPLGAKHPPGAGTCEIVFFEKARPPNASYESIGKVETHVQKNLFFGGRVNLKDAFEELRSKACGLGGNAVIVDDYVESAAAEMSHVHVWARVLKLSR
jgi:hypothetical protein